MRLMEFISMKEQMDLNWRLLFLMTIPKMKEKEKTDVVN